MSDFNLKMCDVSEHESAYQCARCAGAFCTECDRPTLGDTFKTIVRYCPDQRCQREKQLEEGRLVARKRYAPLDHFVQLADAVPRDEWVKLAAIDGTARAIGDMVRTYVRDRFTPGSLEQLDALEKFVYELVGENMRDNHGSYACTTCLKEINVARVRCPACAVANPTPLNQEPTT